MIPIPSLGLASFIGTVLVVLVALAPALVVWWRDRGLLARQDDPALPELIANRRRASVGVLAVALAFLLVFAGGDAAWAIPLLIAALAAAEYPIRTRILGEEWSFARYLWHSVLTLVGSAGFWIALAFVPVVVLRVAAAIGRERVPWIVMFAAIFAAVLVAWETWYPRLWLWTHAAEPLTDPELTARFDEVVRRSGTIAPAVYRVGANGSRFMNAVALPSTKRPAVAMGNALLETLDADEATAIFAHEVAHFDQYPPRRIRRIQLINRLLIIAGVTLPLAVVLWGRAWVWTGWVWPIVVFGALIRRAAKSQQHETESDLRAAELCGDPEAVVRALVKVHLHARIPRRYAVDIERAATHPSLVRRIQAVRVSSNIAASEQLGAATVIQSTRAGSWIVLDDARAYWLDGVPEGTNPELAALREGASSYRAVNYADLVELRVAAAGNMRTLTARTRGGEAWSVPIALHDVARLQRTLDVVDLRLGKAGPGLAAGTPRTIAVVAAAIAMIAGQAGIVLVPVVLAMWKPSAAVLAALGAMSVARAILGAFEGAWLTDENTMRLALVALAAIGLGALYVAHRMLKASEGHSHFRLTMGVLTALVVVVAAALAWQMTQLSPASFVGAPLVGTLATAIVGMAGALFTVRARWSKPAAFAGIVAASALATASVDRASLRLRSALTEASARATPDSETDLGGATHGLRVSPSGVHFMATRSSMSRQGSTFVVFGRFGGDVRELSAVAGDFVDSTRILLLDALDRGVELRLEHVDSVGHAIWADTLAEVDLMDPRLILDRDSDSWAVVGADADDDRTVVFAGAIARRGAARRVVLPDTIAMVGDPIMFGRASTVIVPVYGGQTLRERSMALSPLLMLGGANALRAEMWRVSGATPARVASFRGFPQCGEPSGGVVACSARHARGVSAYTIDSTGTAVEIAQLPMREIGTLTLGPGPRAAAMTFDRSIVEIDLAARRLTRIALPPNTEYSAEVTARPGFVVTLSYGENRRSTVRRYRVDR